MKQKNSRVFLTAGKIPRVTFIDIYLSCSQFTYSRVDYLRVGCYDTRCFTGKVCLCRPVWSLHESVTRLIFLFS